MNSLIILCISVVLLTAGYLFYGSWVSKKWGIDSSRKTPAYTERDDIDYSPAKAPIVLGHHFASIAGAGPINGPIQASVFGWLPVLIWIIVGGIFFGAVQDSSSLFASVRHKGKSIGLVIEENIGIRAKRLFICFAYLTLLLLIAAFTSIVVGTFDGISDDGSFIPANGSTASISILFIVVAIIFGFIVNRRRRVSFLVSSIAAVILISTCIIVGLNMPIFLDKTSWLIIVLIYISVASVAPVWILLQPRDYLSSFLLYGMMAASFAGIIFTHPKMNLPAFTGFCGINDDMAMFPFLFITVACGAISGFHSIVSSGTTSKQIENERDIKRIGFGGMLIECALAVIALITVGILFSEGKMPEGTPTQIFAAGIASMLEKITGSASYGIVYSLVILAVSSFCLTSLDTATRLARYMFQEFFVSIGETRESLTGFKRICANPYFATAVTVIAGGIFAMGGYAKIWPLFGSANQLLAAIALLAVASWLGNLGKSNSMFIFPMAFMLTATFCALIISLTDNIKLFASGDASNAYQGIQIVIISVLMVLALDLTLQGMKIMLKRKRS